jgi:molybdenum cofactor cytidylyltransferase
VELLDVPVAEAAGGILVHSLRVAGRRLRKGHLLEPDDVASLAAAGIDEVTIARLGTGDVLEDEAARLVAAAAAGVNTSLSPAATGRCNVRAEADSLVLVDPAVVLAANRCCEGITVATTRPYARAEAGQTVATCKIIPMAVPRDAVDEVCRLLRAAGGPITVVPFQAKTVALVQTMLPGIKPTVLAKTVDVTRSRVHSLGGSLAASFEVRHRRTEIAEALRAAARGADIVLIVGASAIADRADVVPQAVEAAGGRIEHFGMPVDPGNLTLLGAIGATAVLALPSSFRSPRLHGCDWILWRLFADLPVSSDDIAAMGVGGLIKDIPGRPLPRDRAVQRGR